jgi:hypothetical protein
VPVPASHWKKTNVENKLSIMQEPIGYDPYDPWMSAFGVKAKALFYKGHKTGKLLSVAIALADWLLPNLLRRLSFCQPRAYPISTALWILSRDQITHPDEAYTALMNQTSRLETQYGVSWGLGFPWMSKN